MPKPAYIICSQIASVDRETNLLSLINVIEGITVSVAPGSGGEQDEDRSPVPLIDFYVVAVWFRDSEEADDTPYEWKMEVERTGKETVTQEGGQFSFGKFQFYRLKIRTAMKSPPTESSVMTIVVSIKPLGDGESDWISQRYLMPFTAISSGQMQE